MDLKLIPNCIPPESHGKNLRSMLPEEDWNLLRSNCYIQSEYKCEICGGTGKKHPVEAHEEWTFDMEKRKQILTGIHALCPDCHLVKHIGRAELVGKYERALKHFCKINSLKRNVGEDILIRTMNEQFQYLGVTFKINIDHAKELLLSLFAQQEEVLNAFPIVRKGKKK